MTQLAFRFDGRRIELPPSSWSWIENESVIWRHFYAHSIDTGWPWWTPGFPTESR